MLSTKSETESTSTAKQHESFFRQSGWLMIANVSGGVFMWAVHFLNKFLGPGEYGEFGALLAVVMLVPSIPLQMVLAQQTAKGLAINRPDEVSGVFRLIWMGTTGLWLICAAVVLVFQQQILLRWGLSSSIGLWITLLVVLLSLWLPILWGLLQGQQNFFWLGWSMISNGVGRLTFAALAVLVLLHANATGMISGVFLGMTAASLLAAWHSRSIWRLKPAAIDWRSITRQVLPLFLGFLGFQLLFTADTLFVKSYFNKVETDCYVGAGTLSRALMWLVLPLASVMFPRIVHSATKTEKTNLMSVVLVGTAVLAILGAISLSILGPWVVKLVYKPGYVALTSAVLPWYVSAMVPLAVANVLLNNLLARPAAQFIPSLCVIAVALAYTFALSRFHGSLVMVLQTMGTFNLVLLAVCGWFTWKGSKVTPAQPGG